MSSNEQNLSHEEIWDDSALVNSWNDALQEYKADRCRAEETSDAKKEDFEMPLAKEDELEEQTNDHRQDVHVDAQQSRPPAAGSAFIPAPLLGSVRDEGLKKLLMSWYYAGYYTGYYEGQQAQSQ
ncbi:hypothetical protein PFICI_15024 [Pestalotiopsis fici W106-1]|uniref:Survival Motor Neuron Gemin2-binding domain-containing protein n=1 Tax=Pestalotiopsis fici (strain W106-1 / CGMCC3.15140) TaxID=1229662 RepID=W3WI11_PESFW|nr:uncharacterized protein PFICI_15024 [Pestalotiopsis fici W106-1]ETS73419.1 hypothetical protein PFICI_15024 [Pestalotiopsis fici W106-1]